MVLGRVQQQWPYEYHYAGDQNTNNNNLRRSER